MSTTQDLYDLKKINRDDSATAPVTKNLSSSDGVGGAGDASAANQVITNSRIGEVQANPTPNTLLGRLKSIADSLVFGAKTTPNSISVTGAKATVAPTTSVASSATSVTLLAANTNRTFASFRNDSTSIAYIEFGAIATTSSVYKLAANGFISIDNYTGVISCIWDSANGNMRISEGV